MAASLDQTAVQSLAVALTARKAKDAADDAHADAKLRFLRDAKRASWSLRRMADALAISEPAVRRYWKEHQHRAGRLPNV